MMQPMSRQTKITLGEMRLSGARGLLVYCQDYRCSHATRIEAERWADDVRISDLEHRFICQACRRRGADLRPDFADTPAPAKRPIRP
jgi:hypothetical protein